MTNCEKYGHLWENMAAPGWFLCYRAVSATRFCRVVSYCPACLGTVVQGALVAFCLVHQSCCVEDFPVTARRVESPFQGETRLEQQSFW